MIRLNFDQQDVDPLAETMVVTIRKSKNSKMEVIWILILTHGQKVSQESPDYNRNLVSEK